MQHYQEEEWRRLRAGTLEAGKEQAMLEHLAICPACRDGYLASVTPRAEEAAALLLPDDFTGKIMRGLPAARRHAAPVKKAEPERRAERSRRWRLASYAVAATLTMALTLGGAFSQLADLPQVRLGELLPEALQHQEDRLTTVSSAPWPVRSPERLLPAADRPLALPPLKEVITRRFEDSAKK